MIKNQIKTVILLGGLTGLLLLVGNLLSTHPPLQERIKRLKNMV